MTERHVTTRRGFLKITAAAATAAVVGIDLASQMAQGLRWEGLRGGPDFLHPLTLTLPDGERTQEVEVTLIVETPQEIYRRSLGTQPVSAGVNRLEVPLIYPYEGFVLGDYAYTAILKGTGLRFATAAPVRYTVSPFRWFG